jgi:hypothetical protein
MAAIASTDVAYAMLNKAVAESSYREFNFTVSFGDGVLTYPAGGIPLVAGKLGCPSEIRSLELFSPAAGDGYVYKYDAANAKIRIYQGDNDGVADGPLVELGGAAAPAATVLYANVKGW